MDDGEPVEYSSDREIDLLNAAFFFDLDGTLAEIVEDPGQVRIEATVLDALDKLHSATHGALAVVSGRPVAVLDRLLSPLTLPLSGVHGLEWRGSDGDFHRNTYDEQLLHQLQQRLSGFAAGQDGLIVEEKPGSVALHYRQRPEFQNSSIALARELAAANDSISLMQGKMVVELRLGGRSKADAVAEFMTADPFCSRKPLFVGDDVTDEDAFRFVEETGGLGIKIGNGDTAATLRAQDRRAFEAWLCRVADSARADAELFLGGEIHSAAPTTAAANPGA